MLNNDATTRAEFSATYNISAKQAGMLIDSVNNKALKNALFLKSLFVSWVGIEPTQVTSSYCENTQYSLKVNADGIASLYLKSDRSPFPKSLLSRGVA